jgi:hemolysin III
MKHRNQTIEEERVNAITHGLGIVLTIVTIPHLLAKASVNGNMSAYGSIVLFGIGMMAVYVSSALYHAMQEPKLKNRFHICDHASIFLLIGGSYAPFVQQYCDTQTAIIFLTAQWFIIITGMVFKLFFTGRYDKASLFAYLFLGWSAVFLVKPFMANMPFHVFQWVLVGGLSYTIGVLFYRWDKQKYAHVVWHIFVLGGTMAHCWAVWLM